MSTSVNTIKRLLGIMIGVLIITYIISLNMDNHFVEFNTKWLSNEFMFAIVGGTFASLLVVLMCEIIRYRQIKLMTENSLFTYMANLYGQFLIIRGNCKRALNAHDVVPNNLIQSACDNANVHADYINGIDYTPFCNKSKVKEVLNQFKTEKFLSIKNILISFSFLKMAIREDSIFLLQQGKRDIVTSDCINANIALKKVINQTSTILTYLDQIISKIDSELGNRYHWQNVKRALNEYQDKFETKTLKDYMKEDVVVF